MPTATAHRMARHGPTSRRRRLPRDLQEFFGIPPSPPEALGANIREKRKYWKKKQQKARSDDALAVAGAVLQAIADAEDALTRGAAATGGGDGGVPARAARPARRDVRRRRAGGSSNDSCSAAATATRWTRVQRYEERWGEYPRFIDMRSRRHPRSRAERAGHQLQTRGAAIRDRRGMPGPASDRPYRGRDT